MHAMRLYHVPGSRSTRVLWMLEEAGAPFELTVMKPDDRLGDEHLKRHPLGRVPAADTAGGPLFESAALVLQIADANQQAGLIAPLGSHERALQYQWAFYACTEIEPGFVEFYRHRETDPARADAGRESFRTAAAVVDKLLADRDWLVGGAFSVADVIAGSALQYGRQLELTGGLANVNAYLERLNTRPALVRARAVPAAS